MSRGKIEYELKQQYDSHSEVYKEVMKGVDLLEQEHYDLLYCSESKDIKNLEEVQHWTHQLLVSLKHLEEKNIDLKGIKFMK